MAFSFLAKMAWTAESSACAAALAASFILIGGTARGDDTPAAKDGPRRSKIEISGPATRMANTASSLGAARLEPALRVAPDMARSGSLPSAEVSAMATRPNDRGLAPDSSAIASSTAVSGSTPATFANAGSNTMARSAPMGGGAAETAAVPVAPATGVKALSGESSQTLQRTNADSPLRK